MHDVELTKKIATLRAEAQRVRHLSRDLSRATDRELLLTYALEMEAQALQLEVAG
jgi:hypothetical protein